MFKKKDKTDPEAKNLLTEKDIKAMLAHCKCGKKEDFEPITWRIESVPEARIRDKIARNRVWDVTASSFNPAEKSMRIEHIVKVDQTEAVDFSYADICNEFGWKSFSVSDNKQTLYPKW